MGRYDEGIGSSRRAAEAPVVEVARRASEWLAAGEYGRVRSAAEDHVGEAGLSTRLQSILLELAGMAALEQGHSAAAAQYFREATLLGRSRERVARSNLYRSLAIAFIRVGDFESAEASVQKAIAHLAPSEDPHVRSLRADVYYTASAVALDQHLRSTMSQSFTMSRSFAAPSAPEAISASAPLPGERSIGELETGGPGGLRSDAARRLDQGRAYLDTCATIAKALPPGALRERHLANVRAQRAGFLLAEGERRKAEKKLATFPAAPSTLHPRTFTYVTYLRALTELHAGRHAAARRQVMQAQTHARAHGHTYFLGELHVVAVGIAAEIGDADLAAATMSSVTSDAVDATAYTLRRATLIYTSRFPAERPGAWLPWGVVVVLIVGLVIRTLVPNRPSEAEISPLETSPPEKRPSRENPPGEHASRGSANEPAGPADRGESDPQRLPNEALDAEPETEPGANSEDALEGEDSQERPALHLPFPTRRADDAYTIGSGDGARGLPPPEEHTERTESAQWPFGSLSPEEGAPADALPPETSPLGASLSDAPVPSARAVLHRRSHALPAYDRTGAFIGLKRMPRYLVDDMVQRRFYVIDLGTRFGVVYRLVNGSEEIIRREENGLFVDVLPYACHGLPVYWMGPA